MKGKSFDRYQNVEEFEKITFADLLERWEKIYAGRTAIKDKDTQITYQELAKNSRKIAGWLERKGIQRESIVALQCTNTIGFVELFFGLQFIGAVTIMVLPGYRESEVISIMKKANATAYIGPQSYYGYEYEKIVQEIKKQLPEVRAFTIEEQDFSRMWENTEERKHQAEVSYDEIAVLLLSGGTTGEPKLIPRTHADYIYNAKMSARRAGFSESSVYLAALSIAHNMPLASPGILGTLYMGGKVVLSYYLSPDEVLEAIEEERVTVTGLVPTMAQLCLELLEMEEFDISSLKVLISGGAKLQPSLARELIDGFDCILQNQFGTAEGLIMSTLLDDEVDKILNCRCTPISEEDEVRIVDRNGNEVADGESGELIVRGIYTIESYFHEPQSDTKFTEDGFYRTGDAAVRNPDGTICVSGRIVETINRAGEKIQPFEIEKPLNELKEVQQAVVIAVEDTLLGQKSCAFIQLSEDSCADRNDIIVQLQKSGIVGYKVPDIIEWIEEWPLTKFGKIDKIALKNRVCKE